MLFKTKIVYLLIFLSSAAVFAYDAEDNVGNIVVDIDISTINAANSGNAQIDSARIFNAAHTTNITNTANTANTGGAIEAASIKNNEAHIVNADNTPHADTSNPENPAATNSTAAAVSAASAADTSQNTTNASVTGTGNASKGTFSENSAIMRELYGAQNSDNRAQVLKDKGLAPTANCLIDEVKKKNLENVRLLLDYGVDPNKNAMGEYALYWASRYNDFDMVKLLSDYGAKPDRGFYSELYEAVRNKNTALAQFLIDAGAKANYTDAISGKTILYVSLKNKMYDISRQLIALGARADMYSVRYIQKHKLQYLIPQN